MTKTGYMSGIYIHIPFCRTRCHYCDFYTTTQLKRKPDLVDALIKELELRKAWLEGETIKTIYFGGGTPSLLSADEVSRILDAANNLFRFDLNPEITIEANPDDLSPKQIRLLANTSVNRFSIGIQSFHNHQLQLMNRRHTAQDAIDSVKRVQDAGIHNISVDLIYGLPESNMTLWSQNLERVSTLNVKHLSAYHLTYEKGTVFEIKSRQGKIFPCSEEESILQFKALVNWAKEQEFIHYEISNFGKKGFFSQHNTNYWMQQKYIGLGPSAHSYNIETRSWNVSNLSAYINSIQKGELPQESETLSDKNKHNEFLITSLRTRWGIKLDVFEHLFGSEEKEQLLHKAAPYIKQEKLYLKDNRLILTDEGVFLSDLVLSELMVLPDE
ncbi:MAG: radical SAM family heme chaperone HemW [Salinivirgaceae bacterium]